VRQSESAAPSTALKVSDRSLENDRYRVTLNDAGDIASVFDKAANREIFSAPARLAFQTENPKTYPAWNMDWTDQNKEPRGYVGGAAAFRIVENGPVRVALEVRREAENSVFTQTIRLAAGQAGDRIEVNNHVEWRSRASALKATFPLTIANPMATYNWDLGKIERGNNDPKKYEVPSHQWFDLTDTSGSYGVSILNDAKYGSDKPSDNLLRLTLLYTPGIKNARDYHEQQYQDLGTHDFVYGIYGHAGDWRNGKSDWQSARLGQPLLVFRTSAHEGKLGRSFSLFHLDSEDVAVRALKMAEDNDQIVVRLQELNGTGSGTVRLAAANGLSGAVEMNGLEKTLGKLNPQSGALALDFKGYQLRTLGMTLAAPAKLSSPASVAIKLPYNLDILSFNDAKNDGDCDGLGATIPAEMLKDTVVSEGIHFKIGPSANGKDNAVSCTGQTIVLPKAKFNSIYMLAIAVNGDTDGEFKVDDHATQLHIEDWSGYIGQWDNRVFQDQAPQLTYSVTSPLDHLNAGFIKRAPLAWFCSHRHQQDGSDEVYTYSYLFKYRLDAPNGAKTLTLPDNPKIRVVAVSLVQDENDSTVATLPLYDDFTGRTAIALQTSDTSSGAATLTDGNAPVTNAVNTAVIPAPRDTNWVARHEGFVKQAQQGGIDLLFMGDSITDFWRNRGIEIWNKYYAPRHAADFGISGDRTQHVLWRIEHGELDGIKPKVVVLMIGTNNTGAGKGHNTPAEIVYGIADIVQEFRQKLPETKILLLSVFPRGANFGDPQRAQIALINSVLPKLDDGKMVKYLDIGGKFLEPDGTLPKSVMPDLLHPNAEGYRIWAEAMEPTLAEMLK
jgi:alpha-mannosidase